MAGSMNGKWEVTGLYINDTGITRNVHQLEHHPYVPVFKLTVASPSRLESWDNEELTILENVIQSSPL